MDSAPVPENYTANIHLIRHVKCPKILAMSLLKLKTSICCCQDSKKMSLHYASFIKSLDKQLIQEVQLDKKRKNKIITQFLQCTMPMNPVRLACCAGIVVVVAVDQRQLRSSLWDSVWDWT